MGRVALGEKARRTHEMPRLLRLRGSHFMAFSYDATYYRGSRFKSQTSIKLYFTCATYFDVDK
jgi:hypothetical protein